MRQPGHACLPDVSTDHRWPMAKKLILAVLCGLGLGFLAGCELGYYLASSAANRSRSYLPYEIHPDFRKAEVDPLFRLFASGKTLYTVEITLVDKATIEVGVVDESKRGGVYGFAESKASLGNFWIISSGANVYRYDDHHLFVAISDRVLPSLPKKKAVGGEKNGAVGVPKS